MRTTNQAHVENVLEVVGKYLIKAHSKRHRLVARTVLLGRIGEIRNTKITQEGYLSLNK